MTTPKPDDVEFLEMHSCVLSFGAGKPVCIEWRCHDGLVLGHSGANIEEAVSAARKRCRERGAR